MEAEAETREDEVIHVINALRANLIRREIADKIENVLVPRQNRWGIMPVEPKVNLFQVSRMLRRFERLRMRQWGAWKDKR